MQNAHCTLPIQSVDEVDTCIHHIFLLSLLRIHLRAERGGHPRVEVTRSNDSMTIISYYGTSSNREWDINCVSHTCHVTTDHEARHQHDILVGLILTTVIYKHTLLL